MNFCLRTRAEIGIYKSLGLTKSAFEILRQFRPVVSELGLAQANDETTVNVVIVGAGLSGIGAGVRLNPQLPGKSFAILEGRDAIGGTWDLFRIPGIRSDSDMYTLGYAF